MDSKLKWAIVLAVIGIVGGEGMKLGADADWARVLTPLFIFGVLFQAAGAINAVLAAYKSTPPPDPNTVSLTGRK